MASSAALAAAATDFLPVRMSTSIVCRTLAFSTSAHFSAFGTNQLLFAASAVAARAGLLVAAWSSSAVELGSALALIRPAIAVESVKYLIHWAASSLLLLLRVTPRF